MVPSFQDSTVREIESVVIAAVGDNVKRIVLFYYVDGIVTGVNIDRSRSSNRDRNR